MPPFSVFNSLAVISNANVDMAKTLPEISFASILISLSRDGQLAKKENEDKLAIITMMLRFLK